MICMENTPNFAGVHLAGDRNDFECLSKAIHAIVGDEGEFLGYEQVRQRVLEFCEEIHFTLDGQRGIAFVPNGVDKLVEKGVPVTPVSRKNAYYHFKVLWPEMLFIGFVMNEFIELSAKHRKHFWDLNPAVIRQFQAVLACCLEKTIGDKKFRLLKSALTPTFIGYYQNYYPQYIDYLNVELLKMPKEKRLANISIVAKRIANKDKNYIDLKRKIETEALLEKTCPTEVLPFELCPKEIVW
ncbi:DUF6904 family protein [Sporosarcina saromensis]|uniref:Uncharacterized protein n=1 Tax=Sporosarcina saromensis TaxID=359365 RepID=A0ABU4G7P7_9BACL|nr:hypothetical protein [Sporosarcina saromensis]MDW0113008.1 hypothetical protein [Sporosarcina saromensis]